MQKHLIEIYRSILGNKKCIYVSCPITTGQRAVEFEKTGFLKPSYIFDQMVVTPNINFARQIVGELRKQHPDELFLNPAELGKVKDWTQDHYNGFWCEVIEEFAKENWFLPGWEYSVGCNEEYKTSKHLDLPVRTIHVDKDEIRVL